VRTRIGKAYSSISQVNYLPSSFHIVLDIHLLQIIFVFCPSLNAHTTDKFFQMKVTDFDEMYALNRNRNFVLYLYLTNSITFDLYFVYSRTSMDKT
jgi:hypothetical protein